MKLTIRKEPPVDTKDETLMFKLIKAGFAQRRKTLVNALSNSPELDIPKDAVISALDEAGLDANIRGEKLGLEKYAELANIFTGK